MGYSKSVYEKAELILSQRRLEAKERAKNRREDIFARIPQAEALDREIAYISLQAARSIIEGENAREKLCALRDRSLDVQKQLEELLVANGYSSEQLDEQYTCADCEDTGYIDGIMCDCMKRLLQKTAYEQLNALSPLSLCSFDDFSVDMYSDELLSGGKTSARRKMSRIFEYCVNYAESFTPSSRSILMQGATGLGKTHLSLSIAKEVIAKGFGVVYCSAPNILRQLEKEYFSKENGQTEEALIESDLLIIDDLGTEFMSKFSTSAVHNLVNTRMTQGKPTIINTNFNTAEIEQFYGMRFVSRIIGEFDRLDFVGADVRQIKKMTGMK